MTKSRKNIIIALLIGLIGSIAMLIGINMQSAKTAKAEEVNIYYEGDNFVVDTTGIYFFTEEELSSIYSAGYVYTSAYEESTISLYMVNSGDSGILLRFNFVVEGEGYNGLGSFILNVEGSVSDGLFLRFGSSTFNIPSFKGTNEDGECLLFSVPCDLTFIVSSTTGFGYAKIESMLECNIKCVIPDCVNIFVDGSSPLYSNISSQFSSEEELLSINDWKIIELDGLNTLDYDFYLYDLSDSSSCYSGFSLVNKLGKSLCNFSVVVSENNIVLRLFDSITIPSIKYSYNEKDYLLFSLPKTLYMDVYVDFYNYNYVMCVAGCYSISDSETFCKYAAIPVVLLSTPQLTAIDGGVNISEVENAGGYTYIVNDGAEQTLATAGSIALNNGDTINVKTNGLKYYSDSEYTETYTYYNVKHSTVTVDRYGVASWDSIENATSYEVYVDNELKTTTNSCTYTLTDGQTIFVCSVRTAAENELVYISDNVEEVTYTKETLATPLVSINKNGLVSWTSVPNAEKYIVKLLGVYLVETTDTSYQLYGGNVVEVKAVGNSSLYNDSEYSDRLSYSLTLPSDLREVKVGDDLSGKTLYFENFDTSYHGNLQIITTETGFVVYTPLVNDIEYASFLFAKETVDGKKYDIQGLDKKQSAKMKLPDGMGVVTELNYDVKAYVSASEMGDPIDSGNISDKENDIIGNIGDKLGKIGESIENVFKDNPKEVIIGLVVSVVGIMIIYRILFGRKRK